MASPRKPHERLQFIYSTERLEFIRSARVPRPPQILTLRGGPADGYQHTADIIPDEIELPDEGRYLFILNTDPPIYQWVPA